MKISLSTIESNGVSIRHVVVSNNNIIDPGIYFYIGENYSILFKQNDDVFVDPANKFLASLGDAVFPFWDFYNKTSKELDKCHEEYLSLIYNLSGLVADFEDEFFLVEKIFRWAYKELENDQSEISITTREKKAAYLTIVTITKLMIPIFGRLFVQLNNVVSKPTRLNEKELAAFSIIAQLLEDGLLSNVFSELISLVEHNLEQLQSNELHCGSAFLNDYFIKNDKGDFISRIIGVLLSRYYVEVNMNDFMFGDPDISNNIIAYTKESITKSIKSAFPL